MLAKYPQVAALARRYVLDFWYCVCITCGLFVAVNASEIYLGKFVIEPKLSKV